MVCLGGSAALAASAVAVQPCLEVVACELRSPQPGSGVAAVAMAADRTLRPRPCTLLALLVLRSLLFFVGCHTDTVPPSAVPAPLALPALAALSAFPPKVSQSAVLAVVPCEAVDAEAPRCQAYRYERLHHSTAPTAAGHTSLGTARPHQRVLEPELQHTSNTTTGTHTAQHG